MTEFIKPNGFNFFREKFKRYYDKVQNGNLTEWICQICNGLVNSFFICAIKLILTIYEIMNASVYFLKLSVQT